MKKILVTLLFVAGAGAAFAQTTIQEDPVIKGSVITNNFWSNWFVQGGVNYSAFYSNQEHGLGLSNSPFKGFRSTPSASIAVGKWFSPEIAARIKAYGVWGKTVNGENSSDNKHKFFNIQGQALFNVVNMIAGYDANRLWDLSAFFGAGIGESIDNNATSMTASAGLLNQFHLNKNWALNLELGWIYGEDDYDGTTRIAKTGETGYFWKSHDQHLYAEVGVTYNFGHQKKVTWEKAPDVQAIKSLAQSQIDALSAQLDDANAENARLKDLLANQKPAEPVEKIVKEFITAPACVFFNIDKYNIASKKDLVDVKALVELAKENNAKIVVKGYADSKTGKAPHNQWLSVKRANTVADEIVKMGFSRDNIKVESFGGVLDISPVSYNRRVIVEIVK